MEYQNNPFSHFQLYKRKNGRHRASPSPRWQAYNLPLPFSQRFLLHLKYPSFRKVHTPNQIPHLLLGLCDKAHPKSQEFCLNNTETDRKKSIGKILPPDRQNLRETLFSSLDQDRKSTRLNSSHVKIS